MSNQITDATLAELERLLAEANTVCETPNEVIKKFRFVSYATAELPAILTALAEARAEINDLHCHLNAAREMLRNSLRNCGPGETELVTANERVTRAEAELAALRAEKQQETSRADTWAKAWIEENEKRKKAEQMQPIVIPADRCSHCGKFTEDIVTITPIEQPTPPPADVEALCAELDDLGGIDATPAQEATE